MVPLPLIISGQVALLLAVTKAFVGVPSPGLAVGQPLESAGRALGLASWDAMGGSVRRALGDGARGALLLLQWSPGRIM